MKITVLNQGAGICWENSRLKTTKLYSDTLLGYVVLPDETGILILEPPSEVGPRNAVIFNLDGTEYWRLDYTEKSGAGVCFDRAGISSGDFLVFAVINNRDVGFKIDPAHKLYLDIFESR